MIKSIVIWWGIGTLIAIIFVIVFGIKDQLICAAIGMIFGIIGIAIGINK